MYMKEGMDMRKAMLLTVLFVALWCNSALAVTPVQMNDRYSLYDIVEKYNSDCAKLDDDFAKYMIPNSFTKMDDTFVPYTTAYAANNVLADVYFVACLNNNGKLVAFAVGVPKTRDRADCAIIASRLIQSIDSSNNYKEVVDRCYNSMVTGKPENLYSPTANRYYHFAGETKDNGYYLFVFAYTE
jgi:hypothetical protein